MLTLRTLVEEMGLELACGDDAADAPVRWVHITELPDPTPWLSGGELILTTGPAARRRRSASASSSGCCPRTTSPASGFGTGFDHDTLPKALLEEAEAAGLPGVRGSLRAAVHRAHREGVHAPGERAVRRAAARDRAPQAPRAAGARGAWARRAGARALGRHRRRGDRAGRPRRDAGRARLPAPRRGGGARRVREAVRARSGERTARVGRRGGGVRARPPGASRAARWCSRCPARGHGAAAGVARGRPRRGRAGRLRAPDPAAGGDGRGARADAPARDARHRAPAGGRRAGRGPRSGGRWPSASWTPGCGPFGVGERAAVLVFARRATRDRRSHARPLPGRRRAWARSWPAATTCSAPWWMRPTTSTRSRSRLARAAVLGDADRRCGRRPAAWRPSAPSGAASTRRAARSRRRRWPTAHAPEVASYRDLGAFQLLLALQDDEALRLYCDSVLGPLEDGGGEYGDELVRSLEAFIEQNGQWEKAARAALLPPPHPALPDPARGGADRARPASRPATGSSSGWPCAPGSWCA